MATTAKDLQDLTIDDLSRRADEIREQLFQDRLKLRTGALDKPTERVARKRDLARVLTVLTQKQQASKAAPTQKQG